MIDYELLGIFYLGKLSLEQERQDELLLYESRDLLRHAVCLGDESIAKTGLSIAVIEEAAIDNIPVIAIDSKGELSSLFLTFPNLNQESFLPWVDADEARRNQKSVEQLAQSEAQRWQEGLANTYQKASRISLLQNSAKFEFYTPASELGLSISLKAAFLCPKKDVLEDLELLKEQVRNTTTSLLYFAGIDAGTRSKEHILVSAILENCWKNGKDFNLPELVPLIQMPPVLQFGALGLESFFAAEERKLFALKINNLLASSEMEAWNNGEALDINKLFYDQKGKNKVSVISISHLSESDRMFFVSMFLNQLLSWMRKQSGTSSLRALVYLDELWKYLPASKTPPSKILLSQVLKEAGSYGVGLLLSTEAKTELDHEVFGEMGTWMVSKIAEPEERKLAIKLARLSAPEDGALEQLSQLDKSISILSDQSFLLCSKSYVSPVLFQARWTLSYLRDKLSRAQLKSLKAKLLMQQSDVLEKASQAEPTAAASKIPDADKVKVVSSTAGIKQVYAEVGRTKPDDVKLVYKPMLIGSAQLTFINPNLKVNCAKLFTQFFLIKNEQISWEKGLVATVQLESLKKSPDPNIEVPPLPEFAKEIVNHERWKSEFAEWMQVNQKLQIYRCPLTKLVSLPEESEGEFRQRVNHIARERRDALVEDLTDKYQKMLADLDYKHKYAQRLVNIDVNQQDSLTKETEEAQKGIGNSLFKSLVGRKVPSKLMSEDDRARQASTVDRMGEVQDEIIRYQDYAEKIQDQIAGLQFDFQKQLAEVKAKFDTESQFEVYNLPPVQGSLKMRAFGICWAPCFRHNDGKVTGAW